MGETAPRLNNESYQIIINPKKRYIAALLDIDGVLVNSEGLHYLENKIFFGRYDVNITEADHVKYWIVEGRRGSKGVIADYNLDLDINFVKQEKQKIYLSLLDQLKQMPFAREFLEYLREHEIATAAVTSGYRDSAEGALRRWELIEYMNAIITKEDVTHEKPDPEPYLKGAEALGFDPERCICVEDAPAGVISAKKAGVGLVIACPNEWTRGLSFEGEAKPDIRVASLEEIIKLNLF